MGNLAGPIIKAGIGVGGALAGHWLGNRSAKSAMQRTPEEMEALRGGIGAASGLGQQGRTMFQGGMPIIGQGVDRLNTSGNYWDTLLRGSRSAMSQAVAGPRAALTDQYRGAERGLERSGLRGGVRDLAMAELSRDRAGKIAGLTTGMQPLAAEQLAGVGGQLGQIGLGMTGQSTAAGIGAGNIWARLLDAGTENRRMGQEAGRETANNFGRTLFDILSGTAGSAAAGAAAGTAAGTAAGAGGSSLGWGQTGQGVGGPVTGKTPWWKWLDPRRWFGGGGGSPYDRNYDPRRGSGGGDTWRRVPGTGRD